MNEIHYLISDASKKVDVESHVLRYWEDELELKIPRNEMGHRYYTEFHIRLFKQIKELKEKGYQLKAIKAALEKMMEEGKEELSDEMLSDGAAALRRGGWTGRLRGGGGKRGAGPHCRGENGTVPGNYEPHHRKGSGAQQRAAQPGHQCSGKRQGFQGAGVSDPGGGREGRGAV